MHSMTTPFCAFKNIWDNKMSIAVSKFDFCSVDNQVFSTQAAMVVGGMKQHKSAIEGRPKYCNLSVEQGLQNHKSCDNCPR